MRTAIGLMAGPERPPVPKEIRGFAVSGSIAMPTSVLMSDRMSAPASRAARADSTRSGALGESFTISGRSRRGAHLRDERRRERGRVAEEHSAPLHVRAGDVQLDGREPFGLLERARRP